MPELKFFSEVEQESRSLRADMKKTIRELQKERTPGKVSRSPEQTLDSVLLTTDDLTKQTADKAVSVPPAAVSATLTDNDTLVRNNQAGAKKESVVTQKNLDQDITFQEQIRSEIEAAIAAPDEKSYQRARASAVEKVREFEAFNLTGQGKSTSVLDVISDMTVPAVQDYGARRDNWIKGYQDLLGVSEGAIIPFGESQVESFLDFFRQKDKIFEGVAFQKTKQDFLSIASASSRKDALDFQRAATENLLAFAESPVVQAMAEHPYITSAILDATIVLTPMIFAPVTGGASALVGLAARKALINKFGKLTVDQLVKKLGVNKKLLAQKIMEARMPAFKQVGLGLGAVYVAGEMLKDGSSKTAAFLTEALGPAAAIVFLNLTKSAGLTVLGQMAKNNSTMFKKLNKGLAKRTDSLAFELKNQMKIVLENPDVAIKQTRKQAAAEIATADKSPAAKLLATAEQVDNKTADNIVDMLDVALKGDTAEAAAMRQVIGLDGAEILAASPRLKSATPIFLNTLDDVDEMVKLIDEAPQLGAAFRGVGTQLGDAVKLWRKELATTVSAERKTQLRREINQATRLQFKYSVAAKQFDLKAFDANNAAFMQTAQARLLFSNLPEFQGLNGKILYRNMVENTDGDAVEIQGRTFKYINSTLRGQESLLRREQTFGVNTGVWADSGKSFIGRIIEKSILTPSAHFRTQFSELISTVARGTEQQRVLAASMGEAWRGINKTLSRADRKDLVGFIAEGNHTRQVFTAAKGGFRDSDGKFIAASAKVVDAYQASRALFDSVYRIANLGIVKNARAKGFMLLDDKTIVQPRLAKAGFIDSNSTTVTQAMVDEGYQVVKIFDDDMKVLQEIVMTPRQVRDSLKEIGDTADLLGYHPGYAPIIYKGDWRVASIRKNDEGRWIVKTEAIAKTPKDAQTGISGLIERNGADDQAMYFGVRNNIQPAQIKEQLRGGRLPITTVGAPKEAKEVINSFVKTLDTDATLQKLSDDELDELVKAITDAGIGKEVADDLVAEARYFSGPRHTRKRGNERVRDALNLDEPAEMVDVGESLPIYFDSVAKSASIGDILVKQQDKFLRTYGEFLENPNDWTSKVMIKKARETGTPDAKAKALEAWSVQHQIKVMSGIKTAEQAAIDSWTATWRDGLINRGNFKLARVVDSIANSAGVTAQIRNMTAKGIFGLWNASHYVVQASGILFTLGRASVHNPADIQKAMTTSIKYLYGRVAKKTGMPMDEETKFFVRFMDESGYLANVNYVALDDLVGHNVTGVGKLFDASAIATKKGEATQRLFAMSWNFHNNLRLIKKGKHPLGFTLDDVGGVKFRDHVKNQADLTAFNMSKVNQPLYAQGVAGLSFQFTQIMSQMAQLFFGVGGAPSTITKLERFGIWATTVAALGPKAVPFSETAVTFADNFMARDIRLGNIIIKEGDPKDAGKVLHQLNRDTALFIAQNIKKFGLGKGDEKFWRRWAEGGFVKAASGGAVDFVDRATLQLMTNTYYDNIEATDALGPGMNVLIKMVGGTIEGVDGFVTAVNAEDDLEPSDILKNAKKAFGVLGGARNVLSTIEALIDGKVTTRSGRAIMDGLSLSEIMQAAPAEKLEKVKDLLGVAAGLPGERQKQIQKENIVQARQKEAWDEWKSVIIRSMFRARNEGNLNHAFAIMGEATNQIMKYRPGLLMDFQKNTFAFMNYNPNETMEQRNRRLEIRFNLEGMMEAPLF